jgi:hypothetical protein
MAPSSDAFDGSGTVPIDFFYPFCYPRSSQRPDPNDARLLLLNPGNNNNNNNHHHHNNAYPWQSPAWTLQVWGQYVLNTRLSGSHGGSGSLDTRDGNKGKKTCYVSVTGT